MTDIFTPEKRSYVMSRIRSKGTKIEVHMRDMLRKNCIRFKEHPNMEGNPDFLVGKNVIVFCDGSFWHGFDYKHGRVPRQKFWREKIERNMQRDIRISRRLRHKGYSVLRIWEHDINKKPDKCIRKIKRALQHDL